MVVRVALSILVLLLSALAVSCSDSTGGTPDTVQPFPDFSNDGVPIDVPQPILDGGDAPPPILDGQGGCTLMDGQSCDGGQSCPTGQQPVRDAQNKCFCRVPCNPTGQNQCGGAVCERVCVQLVDTGGQPIPGQGACIPDPGKGVGEPCAPDSCKVGLECVGPNGDEAFCRKTCNVAGDCSGYKMVCGQLTGQSTKVCVPGGNPGGPTAGGDCSDASTFCSAGHICDPVTKKCLKVCNTDGTPPPAQCTTSGESCQKIEDTAASVLIGYGCQPGGAPADGGGSDAAPSDGGAG
ncbi:MAG: hypothetical protein KC503_38485 [Myxococcales bacterium]|nr:hypothetical protein [Myxococcales bacterium]